MSAPYQYTFKLKITGDKSIKIEVRINLRVPLTYFEGVCVYFSICEVSMCCMDSFDDLWKFFRET